MWEIIGVIAGSTAIIFASLRDIRNCLTHLSNDFYAAHPEYRRKK